MAKTDARGNEEDEVAAIFVSLLELIFYFVVVVCIYMM